MKSDEDVIIEREELMAIHTIDNGLSETRAINGARPEMLRRMERAGESRQEAVFRYQKLQNKE